MAEDWTDLRLDVRLVLLTLLSSETLYLRL
jgi:hypothetical protein